MANVLNKLTKVFLQSVNTPEYAEADWIINPDLSAVQGVPSCYWVIVETVVVDSAAYDITDPDTQEVTHVEAVTHTEYSVREMTAEEKAVVDAQNTQRIVNRLADGTVAYLYKGEHVISVNIYPLCFSVRVAGAKKFTVPFLSTSEAFTCDRNRLVTNISVSAMGDTFDLVLKVDGVERERFHVVPGTKLFNQLAIRIESGEHLSFAIDSTQDITNPVILVDTNYID